MRSMPILFIAIMTASPAWSQPLAPESPPANLGGRPFYRILPRAWIGLVVDRLGSSRDFPEMTIDLAVVVEGRERNISSTRVMTAADVERLVMRGALSFGDVPTELPLRLRIAVRSNATASTSVYTESYVLHYPIGVRIKAANVERAFDEAGHLGDFAVDAVRAVVVRRSSP